MAGSVNDQANTVRPNTISDESQTIIKLKESLLDIFSELPRSAFKTSFVLYINNHGLFGNELTRAIIEDFSHVEKLYGDPAFNTTTLRMLRDLLLAKGVSVDKRQGCKLSHTVAKAIYGIEHVSSDIEDLLTKSASIVSVNNSGTSGNSQSMEHLNTRSANHISQRFKDKKYDGSIESNISEYLAEYTSASRDFELSLDQKLRFFHIIFTGQAKRFYYSQVESVAQTFEHAKELMEREYNSISRQNRILGVISSLRFERSLISNKGDYAKTLEKLTSKIAELATMIPKEYRHESHLKRFVYDACIGETWASSVLSRTMAETNMTFNAMCELLSAAIQQHIEEESAKKLSFMKRPPQLPDIYSKINYEEMSKPKYYGQTTAKLRVNNPRIGQRVPSINSRCRGCGSSEHWLRDGKCSGKDVADFLFARNLLPIHRQR
jgi:hypothetical protein